MGPLSATGNEVEAYIGLQLNYSNTTTIPLNRPLKWARIQKQAQTERWTRRAQKVWREVRSLGGLRGLAGAKRAKGA